MPADDAPPPSGSERASAESPSGVSHAIAQPVSSTLVCHGCGYQAPLGEIRPYRCRDAEAKDNIDHALRRAFDSTTFRSRTDPEALFRDSDPNPFRKFRRLFYSYEIARIGGIPDSAYLRTVDRIDSAIHGVEGRGFRATPFATEPGLARAIDLEPGSLWVKDETGNVSGSHKGRHLMGILLWLEIIRALRRPLGTPPPLAIASCGNAALAAAVLARAAGRPLEVFVPPEANRRITERLTDLGSKLTACPRRAADPFGDPCYLRFLEAVQDGALPFTVQGNSNGLASEGGSTIVWEMVSSLMAAAAHLDHLVIQVGGGGLAASCIEGLRNARDLGLTERLPRIHTVQTAGGYPLRRAYDRLVARLLQFEQPAPQRAAQSPFEPSSEIEIASARALRLRDDTPSETVGAEVAHAVRHRADFMWAWETPPRSIAYGILDDETYDWVAVVEGMLETGGIPLVVSEACLAEAHRRAREQTTIPVEPTGSAGLAGLIELRRAGVVRPEETAAVLFTGVER